MSPPAPWMRRCLAAAAALVATGCALVGRAPRVVPEDLPPPTARQVSYRGWDECWRLSNGLVRLTNVPQVGGRTLEYALGDYNFLFVGGRELGTVFDEAEGDRYQQFGGHFVRLHPVSSWRRVQSSYPPALFLGGFEARRAEVEGPAVAVEMAAPPDLATRTRLVRRIELFPASTRVRVSDTLTSFHRLPQEWGIHDFLQLKGHPARSGVLRGTERPTGELGLYLPLNPRSRFPHGVDYVMGGKWRTPARARQWSTSRLPGLLALRYRGRFSKVLVDPVLPWVAFVDRGSEYAFVQRCEAPRKAVVAAGPPMTSYPFIEVQCLGPVARLAPGESTTLVQEWFAARCPGPVLDVTPAGAVAAPLSLLRGEGKTLVEGTFGVFYVGRASLVFRGRGGAELARRDCGPVDPLHVVELKRTVDIPGRTAEVALEVLDGEGRCVGHLGRIRLGGQ
ncbi:MAG: hypothetical protein ACLF0G_07235 [Candidatus Brocadiia bacterium]